MTPVDKALLVSAEQILRINGYEAEAGAVGRVGENLESAERDAGRWRTIETASMPKGPTCRPSTAELGFTPVLDACCGSRMFWFDRKDSRATFVDKRRERHSEKPDASYELIEAVSPGPRLELFARRKRGDWHTWGNEVPCDVSMGHNA